MKSLPRQSIASASLLGLAIVASWAMAAELDAERPPLPPSALPLELTKGERIALIGNSTAERMNLFGNFETLLHTRYPNLELVVRNFARPADEVANRQRPTDYTKIDDPLAVFAADTYLCFFGFNESYAGPEGVDKFKSDYKAFLEELAQKYPRDKSGARPRFVLVTPLAFEATGDPLLPEGTTETGNLELYAEAVAQVGKDLNLAVVNVFPWSEDAFAEKPGMQWTINGCHLNAEGDAALAEILFSQLFGKPSGVDTSTAAYKKLRDAVNDKAWTHLQDYRMLNGWYVYGGRRTWDTETFPREYQKIRNMVGVRDRYVWDIAAGKSVPSEPDDSQTGELIVPPTRFGNPRQKYSEAEELRYLTPEEFVGTCTLPPGFEIKPFADERKFPELAKPVQMTFDNRGRLWLSTMPSYPQWRPGDPKPADKLIILEDTDSDGTADVCKTFYDKLHCPTGFEFYNGGVLVVDQPRIIWLKDTDGDDKADVVVHLLDGFATDDTHHTVGAFESDHGGRLHMLEGIAMSTTVETPWGPFRNFGTPGAYIVDPHTLKISHFVTPGYGNPWCYVFDEWGQGIVGDGTSAVQHWDTPLSGAQFGNRRGLNPIFNNEGMRPCIGSDFLVTRNFPDDVQKQFTYACVINMNGMPRWEIHDDGAGFGGSRIKQGNEPFDLVRSTDKHFRPVDPQIGPDGALWFGDWSNALIGHMQYSQRDPNRDHQRGRVYRLVYRDRPLVEPFTQHGKPVRELLDQFRAYEWRTREHARCELRARPAAEVQPVVAEWAAALDASDPANDRLLCEALWVQEGHHAVTSDLLARVLAAKSFQARAAATRVVADERDYLGDAFAILVKMSADENPRVRTEAIRGLSFYDSPQATDALLAAAKMPLDYWTRYTLEHALGAHEASWRQAFITGQVAVDNPVGQEILTGLLGTSQAGAAAMPYLRQLLGQTTEPDEVRNKAMTALADMKGDAGAGRQVFLRTCTACHKIGADGREYGPDLTKIAEKRTRFQLVQSLIDPNAEVDMKYLSTSIVTSDGKTITGLLVSETPEKIEIFDGKELQTIAPADVDERETLKQSSMPEGLPGAMAPAEFLDLVEYLSTLK